MPRKPVQLRSNISVKSAESVLMPIMKRRDCVQDADPRHPTTYLKAGSSTAPETRYRPADRYEIPRGNVVAVTNGHSKNVEKAIINNLDRLGICDNVIHDVGQKPPFVNMDGKVSYYLAEKKY